jgi:hypothetical protein
MSDDMDLYDLRVTVDSIAGRPVFGLAVGDYFEVTESSRLRLPPGGHFRLARAGQPGRLPGSGGTSGHADNPDRSAVNAHVRPHPHGLSDAEGVALLGTEVLPRLR